LRKDISGCGNAGSGSSLIYCFQYCSVNRKNNSEDRCQKTENQNSYFHFFRVIKIKSILPFVLFIYIFILPFNSFSQNWDISSSQKKIYEELISLRLPTAKKLLEEEQKNTTFSKGWNLYLEDLYDFLNIIISQDKNMYDDTEKKIEARVTNLQKLEKNSPAYAFIYGEILFHRSMIRFQFNHYIKGGLDFRKGFQLLSENEKKFPEWLPNKKSLGLYHIILGTIPDEFQWFNQLLGMEGARNLGLKEMALAMGDASMFHLEAQILYPAILSFLDIDTKKAVEMTQRVYEKDKRNLLSLFITAIILQKEGHNESALRLLENFQITKNYTAFNYIYYMKGECQRNKGEYEKSIVNYKIYLENAKNKEEKADAFYQIAHCYWLLKDEKNANEIKNKICSEDNSEYERLIGFCKKGFPNRLLLSSRFYFDGGYYEKAESLLSVSGLKNFSLSAGLQSRENHLEYLYRLGRIYQKQKQNPKAILQFRKALQLSPHLKESTTYFVPYSCFQTGNVFFDLGNIDSAKYYYAKSLTFRNFQYEKSLQYEVKQKLKEINQKK